MVDERTEDVASGMREINRAWLEGRVDDLGRVVHPEIVMTLPGFAGRVRGSPDFVLGFKEFCDSATILQRPHSLERSAGMTPPSNGVFAAIYSAAMAEWWALGSLAAVPVRFAGSPGASRHPASRRSGIMNQSTR
jgi:hypothetical protein